MSEAELDLLAHCRRQIGIAGRLDHPTLDIDVEIGHRPHRLDQKHPAPEH
jgi:hypothetical protein